MFHLAERAVSAVLAKSVLFGQCYNLFRALVSLSASGCRNCKRCDALAVGGVCGNRTVPIISVEAFPVALEYKSLSSYVTSDRLRYCRQRRMDEG